MTALSSALAAMDKIKKVSKDEAMRYGLKQYFDAIDDANIDALAWIKKALPYIGEIRDSTEDTINMYNPEFMSEESLEAFKEELENLDALLTEAKGEGK